MEKLSSGVDTTYKDKDGKTILVHSYVKDGDGNKYFINGYCQAVPVGNDAPAMELSKLLETSEVSVLGAEEVLNVGTAGSQHLRRRRKHKEPDPADSEGEPAALQPVDMRMVLSVIPDDALAGELRRRGYCVTAVKPALISL